MRKYLLGLAVILLTGPLMVGVLRADVVQLVDNHPDRHVVVKGDTLWDISGAFLKSPWLWPKVWSVNPQIDNPHLIFPGDVIYLVWVNGQPQLRLDRGPRKLGPQVRRSPLDQAIKAIPLQDIKSFLSDNLVLTKSVLEEAPYVIAGVNERIIAGAGDRIYARGELPGNDQNYYGIYRPARIYKDPDTEEVLGYESKTIGGGYLVAVNDDIMTLTLKRTREEVRKKDRVLPTLEEVIQSVFYPSAPEQEVNGKILSVLRGVTQIGQYDVVAINRGKREGMAPGHVLHVFRRGEVVKDPVNGELVTLPSEKGGTIMIFKVFEKVSYALVMKAENVLSVLDEVRTPN
ncbi:MAG: LysM peptidoglycan-binding domain-containing protein [Motiliproteus sp.]